MPDIRTITLPDRDEMLRRLLKADSDSHLVAKFYPLILEHAGEKLDGPSVVNILTLAIAVYVEACSAPMYTALEIRLRTFLAALIDDEQALQEAYEIAAEIGL